MISCLLITTKGTKGTKSGGLASSHVRLELFSFAHFAFFAVDPYRPDDPCVIQPDVRTPRIASGLGIETAKGEKSAKPVGFVSVGAGAAFFSFVHFAFFAVDLHRPDDSCVIQPDVRTLKIVSGLGIETAKGEKSAKPVGFVSIGAGTALFSFVHFVSFVVKHNVRHPGPVCRTRCPA